MKVISVKTSSQTELVDITSKIQQAIEENGFKDGIATIYVPHTTAGVTINEGADPAVKRDILAVLNEIIPWRYPYQHAEGNSPAHIKTTLTGPSVQVIVEDGRLCLGTWQRVFFCEYDGPRNRKVWLKTL